MLALSHYLENRKQVVRVKRVGYRKGLVKHQLILEFPNSRVQCWNCYVLFFVMINDLSSLLNSYFILYANDTNFLNKYEQLLKITTY